MSTAIDEVLTGTPSIETCEILIRAFKELVESDGWKFYRAIVEKQQTVRLDGILLVPLQSMDAALEQEYSKGEISGMRTALQFPPTMIESLSEQLHDLRIERDRQTAEGESE